MSPDLESALLSRSDNIAQMRESRSRRGTDFMPSPYRLPVIPIPLRAGDPDAQLDLQALVDQSYERAGYDLEIDYTQDPIPPLDAEMAGWADQLLRSKGLR
jgi:hypothetical protein